MVVLDKYTNQITQLCKAHDVKSLSVFGSVLTNNFAPDSDIDFIVDFSARDPIDYAEKYFQLKFSLEELLNRHIDLLELKSLQNPYLRSRIDSTKVTLYGSAN